MTAQSSFTISLSTLDQMMPMCMLLNSKGVITHAGPTLIKVFKSRNIVGSSIFRLIEMRRPKEVTSIEQVCKFHGAKLYMKIRDEHATSLIGAVSCIPECGGVLLNLSFGIAVVDAVRRYGLAGSDFAATDLTVEMLYLVEAKTAAMETSNQMALRFHGEKSEAEAEAMSDELTGLRNRRALDQVMQRLLSTGSDFALMHLDLDYFKAVNDTKGHAAGDHVLQVVAEILTSETRDNDTVSRVGGDEFVLVLPQIMEPDQLKGLANRLIKRLEEPIYFRSGECSISASIGVVTTATSSYVTSEQMIDDADIALYASKEAGRAQFTLYSQDLRDN
ncbi:diguanylate cyclase [Aliiroseovarius sp. KMU-50]|uniref:guanylate cyclase n=1 Tax=Aliiroseovarius salicola TaxID=3009082 RepID=A0ABT4W0T6_9RHOB|nr:diguanylate cyclase [Aliiroseovarius sp. KMU-50]MDA5094121.1 diguanylate cyclase [Aliiroseovarius sp. KMU-50]